MFNAYSDEAKAVIGEAEKGARAMGHKLVGTEHILLAFFCDHDAPLARLLLKNGLSSDSIKLDVLKLAGWGEKLDFGGSGDSLPMIFDPSTKRALEQSVREMASCGDEYISVEHLFMGITHRADTMASLLLEKRGLARARLREEVKKLIAERSARGFHNGVPQGGGGPAAAALPRHEDKDESRGEKELIHVLVQRITLLEEKVAALSAVNTVHHAPLVGMGFDSHRLKEGRELVVGGIKIPFRAGLDGHSDADVLLHAVIDALLGAMGRGDIGTHFPDSDERYRGISSVRLLERCAALVDESSLKVASLDSIIIAQEPRLAPHIGGMKSTIAAVLGLPAGRVSVKAKTAEGMGYVGQGQGIAAYALAVLVR